MVLKTEFKAFLEIIEAEILYEDDTRIHALVENHYHEEPDIELEWMGENNDPPVIAASPSPISGRAYLRVSAPAPEWEINQTVDDHNLLTALKVGTNGQNMDAAVEVYGPTARHTADGIEITDASGSFLLEKVIAEIEEEQ